VSCAFFRAPLRIESDNLRKYLLSAGYVFETNKEFYGTFLSFQYVDKKKENR
jgi:hypothetical protein